MGQSLGEECGVFAIFDNDGLDVPKICYYALYSLQHRGQESCGVAINDNNEVKRVKGKGLVSEVFTREILDTMKGQMAIGHVRYSTQGDSRKKNIQPLVLDHLKGTLSVAHNGQISNASILKRELELSGSVFYTAADTEVIALLLIRERLNCDTVDEAIRRVMPRLEGAYSLVIMSQNKIFAVRDPSGFRPLCMGKLKNSYVFASESCAFNAIGAEFIRDLEPGEIVCVTADGVTSNREFCNTKKPGLCIFEHIYFARPDSIIDGQSVYGARIEAGRMLARNHPVEADLVVGVPDSGITAAIGYSRESGIPYGEAFIKNRYVGRTFIQPEQQLRELSVSIKLNIIKSNIEGKRIIMIDDSIVRGTTTKNIIKSLKAAGAKEVHVRISSPPFLYPCYFGTDVPDSSQLASRKFSVKALTEHIGADSLGFLDVKAVTDIAKDSNLTFCTGCFSGKYPIEVTDKENRPC